MPRTVVNLVAVAGVMSWMGASSLSGQQQVHVTVSAVPNPVPPGSCTRIVTDVRDELNRQLTLENGVPLQWANYDFTSSNGADFEWRGTPAGEYELCAKPGAGAVSTQVTATIKGMPYNGATVVAVGGPAPGAVPGQPNVAPPTSPAQAAAPGSAAGAAQGQAPPAYTPPAAGSAASAAPGSAASAPAGGGAGPATAASGPPPAGAAPGAQGYAPAPAPTYSAPAGSAAGAAPGQAPPAPPQQAQAKPVKSGGGFFKKIGSHIKQKAAEVKTETAENLTLAATQVVDTTFQTGSRLVASTTAEVSNTARMNIGGVGQKLMLAPQRGGAPADNLKLAIASGRAVLPEMRFTPGTAGLELSAQPLMQNLADQLKEAMAAVPGSKFVIEAHVDSVPNAQVLSEYRAAAVKQGLVGKGVDAARLIALGYGTSRPPQAGNPPTARIEVVRVQ